MIDLFQWQKIMTNKIKQSQVDLQTLLLPSITYP